MKRRLLVHHTLTMKRPLLFEQAKRRGGLTSIFLSFSRGEVRYAAFPPRASQKLSVRERGMLMLLPYTPAVTPLGGSPPWDLANSLCLPETWLDRGTHCSCTECGQECLLSLCLQQKPPSGHYTRVSQGALEWPFCTCAVHQTVPNLGAAGAGKDPSCAPYNVLYPKQWDIKGTSLAHPQTARDYSRV